MTNWRCYCGHFDRIKFKDMHCPICFCDCKLYGHWTCGQGIQRVIKQYSNLPIKLIALLADHHLWMVEQARL